MLHNIFCLLHIEIARVKVLWFGNNVARMLGRVGWKNKKEFVRATIEADAKGRVDS